MYVCKDIYLCDVSVNVFFKEVHFLKIFPQKLQLTRNLGSF